VSSKSKKARRHAAPVPPTPAQVHQQGTEALAQGRFRDAIGHFKALAKAAPDGAWEEGLAAAYRGRALELEAKGMGKEALTIWDNRSKLCPGLPPEPPYLALLLRHGRAEEALRGYATLARSPDAAGLSDLRARLAAFYLVGIPGLEALAADDPVSRDGAPAAAALAAYCRGDDSEATERLREIPFRSPYRDLAAILKALLTLPSNPGAAARLLDRVPGDSPFTRLAGAARLGLATGTDLLAALGGVDESARAFAMALHGWPEGRRRLWRELLPQGGSPSPGQLAGVLQRYRSQLGDYWVRQQTLRLGHAVHPSKLSPAATRTLTRREQLLAIAWHNEKSRDPWDMLEAWEDLAKEIARGAPSSAPPSGSDDALRIALIWRHLATDLGLLKSGLAESVELGLEHALRLDPGHRPGYLLLAAHYRRNRRLKETRRVLDRALGRWPEDPDVLNEALETALAADAYKKAAGLAKRILERDPINRRAKLSLFRAHLAHARKQIGKGRSDLAERELTQAESWAETAAGRARIELLRGLLGLTGGSRDEGLVRTACAALGGGLAGRLAVAAEAEQLGLAPAKILKAAALLPMPAPDPAALLAFCRQLRETADSEGRRLGRAWDLFRKVLEQAASLPLSHQQAETVCETFRLAGQADLRLAFARAALGREPGEPVFVLHVCEADISTRKGRPWLTETGLKQIEEALKRAQRNGDNRTAHRLEELLHAYAPLPRFPLPPPDLDSPFPRGLPKGLGIETLIKLLKGIMGKELGDLERELGHEGLKRMIEQMLESDEVPPLPPELDSLLSRRRPKRRRGQADKTAGPDGLGELDLF
jgi:tetratricopeptide (TPR) repeat protein